MAMELEYDRSLYGVEHKAGPFEITDEIIDRANSSTGESGPAFKSDYGAKEHGYRSRIAPPTLPCILVRQVSSPDVKVKFGNTQMHAGQRVEPKAPVYHPAPVVHPAPQSVSPPAAAPCSEYFSAEAAMDNM